MNIEATFVKSAAAASDLPRHGLAEIALVGRSNVGKSSLINALVRQRVARTSGAPGKTRLANLYHVSRGTGEPFYLVDLPGYGYARGGTDAALEFDELVRAYFGRDSGPAGGFGALLLLDARHPGLPSDIQAWHWLQRAVEQVAPVVTKIDKLARGERIRALTTFESVLEDSVLPVSAVTGEGLDELWKVIERLRRRNNNNNNSQPRADSPSSRRNSSPSRRSPSSRRRKATDRPPLPRRKS